MTTTVTTRCRRRKCGEVTCEDRHMDVVVALVEVVHRVAPAFAEVDFMRDHHEAVIEVGNHEVSLEDTIKHRLWRKWFRSLARMALKCSL